MSQNECQIVIGSLGNPRTFEKVLDMLGSFGFRRPSHELKQGRKKGCVRLAGGILERQHLKAIGENGEIRRPDPANDHLSTLNRLRGNEEGRLVQKLSRLRR